MKRGITENTAFGLFIKASQLQGTLIFKLWGYFGSWYLENFKTNSRKGRFSHQNPGPAKALSGQGRSRSKLLALPSLLGFPTWCKKTFLGFRRLFSDWKGDWSGEGPLPFRTYNWFTVRTWNKIKISSLYEWFPSMSEDVYLLPNFSSGLLAMSKDSKTLLNFEQSSHGSVPVLRAYHTLGTVMCPLT